ncbi:MAG TPA: hypothetical protein PLG41_24395, partial [Leptospiraceae bacterium]|nr:hypothetical protein [Leptospiraceae bacterium]
MKILIMAAIICYALSCNKKETSRVYEYYLEDEPSKSQPVVVRVFDSRISENEKSDVREFINGYLKKEEYFSIKTSGFRDEYLEFEKQNHSRSYFRVAVSPNNFYIYENFQISKLELIDDETISVNIDYALVGEYDTHLISFTKKREIKTDTLLIMHEDDHWRIKQSATNIYYTKEGLMTYLEKVGRHDSKYYKLFKVLKKELIKE